MPAYVRDTRLNGQHKYVANRALLAFVNPSSFRTGDICQDIELLVCVFAIMEKDQVTHMEKVPSEGSDTDVRTSSCLAQLAPMRRC